MRTRCRRTPSIRPIAPVLIRRTRMSAVLRPRRWYGVLLLLLGQLLASASAQQQPANAPLYTQDDLMFLTMMIMHHQQALEMAALVPSRSHREEFIRFARYVDGAQRAEIDQMKALLEAAAERGL